MTWNGRMMWKPAGKRRVSGDWHETNKRVPERVQKRNHRLPVRVLVPQKSRGPVTAGVVSLPLQGRDTEVLCCKAQRSTLFLRSR